MISTRLLRLICCTIAVSAIVLFCSFVEATNRENHDTSHRSGFQIAQLSENKLKELNNEAKMRGFGINPDTMPTQDEADNYKYAPQRTMDKERLKELNAEFEKYHNRGLVPEPEKKKWTVGKHNFDFLSEQEVKDRQWDQRKKVFLTFMVPLILILAIKKVFFNGKSAKKNEEAFGIKKWLLIITAVAILNVIFGIGIFGTKDIGYRIVIASGSALICAAFIQIFYTLKNNLNLIKELFKDNLMVGKFLSILFLLFIVIFSPFPNGVYTLLRIVITLFASWSAFRYSLLHQNSGVWIFGFVAILFNPVITVHFTRGVWLHLDLLTAMIFIISFYFDAKRIQPSS